MLIKTEQHHTIKEHIKSCNEDVSENLILHSSSLQSPSDKLLVQSAGSIQREINPHIEFQFHEERLQSWGDVVQQLDINIKERENDYAFSQEYNHAFAQECIAERIVVLKRHHQEATKQCNKLNRLHQGTNKAENKSSNKYFSRHRLCHSVIVLTKHPINQSCG